MNTTSNFLASGAAGPAEDWTPPLVQAFRLLGEPRDLTQVAEGLSEHLRALLGVDLVVLWLREEPGDLLCLWAHAGELHPLTSATRPGASWRGLLDRVAACREPQVLQLASDAQLDEHAWLRAQGVVSFIGVPVLAGEELHGVLAAMTRQPRSFSPQDRGAVECWAAATASARENARRAKQQERRLAESQQLVEITRVVSSAAEVKEILRQVCRRAALLCGADRGSIFLWDEDGKTAVPAMSQLASGKSRRQHWNEFKKGRKPLSQMQLVKEVAATGRPVTIDDARTASGISKAAVKSFGLKSVLAVPLAPGDEVIGALILDTMEEVRPFGPRQQELAVAVADRLGLALQKVQLRKKTEARLRQTEAQLEIGRVLSSTLEYRPLLRELTRQAARVCNVDRCSINLVEGGLLVPKMSQRADGREEPELWQVYKNLGPLSTDQVPVFAELVRTRQPVVIEDAQRHPLWPPPLRQFGNKTVMAVPLIRQDRVIGLMLYNHTERPRPVTSEQVALATNIGSQVALTLENARLYEETQRRLRRTENHLEIAHTLSSTLELKPLLKEITRQTARACDMDRCTINLVEGDRLVPMMSQYADGEPRPEFWQAFKGLEALRVADLALFSELSRRRRPIVLSNPQEDVLWPEAWRGFGDQLVLAVPLIRHEKVIGTLVLANSGRNNPVESEQVSLATTIASQVALTLDNARLYEETQRRLRQTEAHLEIARTVNSTVEPQKLLEEITRQAARACSMDRCSVYLFERKNKVVPLMSQFADGAMTDKIWRVFKSVERIRLGDIPFLAETARTGQPVLLDGIPDHPLWPNAIPSFDIKVMLVVPFVRQEKVVGAMTLTNHEGNQQLQPGQVAVAKTIASQVAIATTIASQVALALDNSRLYNETQRRLRETRSLLGLAQTIGSSLDQTEIARQTSRELANLLGADTAVFYEIDEAKGQARGRVGYRVPKELFTVKRQRPLETSAPFAVEAQKSGLPVATSDLPNDPRFDVPSFRSLPLEARSLVYAPVVSKGRRLGGLMCFWWHESRTFTEEELGLAGGIADQMGLMLDNARHYQQAQKAVADLQAAQDQLVRSEKFRALAEMAGGVAHDFNNLLTAILGQTELLRFQIETEGNSGELRANLDTVEVAARDGAEIVRRLLDFTRARHKPESAIAVDVNELLVYTREVTRPRWQGQRRGEVPAIDLELELGGVPAVTGNPAELREVLLNLVLNAIDALPNGGTLTLASGFEGDWVWIKVRDTGVGMSEEVSDRVFEPYFTTKGASGSSGLGLSSSYGIIHRHGGEIEVESAPGAGTTFTLKLPV